MIPRGETGLTGPTRHLRVVPVLFGALLVAVVALAVSPGLRHQLARSLSRQDQGYLELFFVDEQAARTCQRDEGGRVQLEVGIRSHFESTRTLAWTVTVHPTRGTVRAERDRITVGAGRTAHFTAGVPVVVADAATPSYSVDVTLADHDERLLLHC